MGFFTLDNKKTLGRELISKGRKLSKDKRIPDKPLCHKCKLNEKCLSPNMPPTGEGKRKAGVIAEAPGEEEDKRGKQLVGTAGKVFRTMLIDLGYNLDRDFIKTNALACRPPNNRKPKAKEIEYCRPNIIRFFNQYKPKLVLLLGESAVHSVINWEEDSEYAIGRWRGFVIPDRRYNCWLAPTYHPSFVNRKQKEPVVELIVKRDLEYALSFIDKPLPPFKEEDKCVELLYADKDKIAKELLTVLNKARKGKVLLCFDYETTGLKPHAEGHKIACASFCYDFNKAYCFLMLEDIKIRNLWKRVLTHPNIYKVAHNLKFEDTWTYHILGYRPRPWFWDTMLAAHIIDNRPGICGLKFQAYVHFGLMGYDTEIKKYLESDGGGNAFNRVFEAPLQLLLKYCAIDALATFRLLQYQLSKVNPSLAHTFINDYTDMFVNY